MSDTNEKDALVAANKEVKQRMGISARGRDDGQLGIGTDAAISLMEKAVSDLKSVKSAKHVARNKGPTGRKKGGQPGNKNAGGGATAKGGIYLNAPSIEDFDRRFPHYSRSLGKADAKEEVALTRAMLMNVIAGKDPLGFGVVEEPELLNAYVRDMLMLNNRAQEMYLKQERDRRERLEKENASRGMNIQFTTEAMNAMNGMAEAQDVGMSPEELMQQARERIEEQEAARAEAENG